MSNKLEAEIQALKEIAAYDSIPLLSSPAKGYVFSWGLMSDEHGAYRLGHRFNVVATLSDAKRCSDLGPFFAIPLDENAFTIEWKNVEWKKGRAGRACLHGAAYKKGYVNAYLISVDWVGKRWAMVGSTEIHYF